MQIGTVKEIKNNENRVGLTPNNVAQLVKAGHTVVVEKNAGLGSGFSNEEYKKAGATLCNAAQEVWEKAELVVKVKEPLEQEFEFIQPNQIIFTFFHFASNEKLLDRMLQKKAATIAYETVGAGRQHPLLAPMSEVAGKMAVQMGAYYLAKFVGGKGILLSGVSGVEPAHVVVLGTGMVGKSAAVVAQGMGAKLSLLVHNPQRIPELQEQFFHATILQSTPENIAKTTPSADLLIGAVYATGAKAPVLVSKELVQKMQKGSVIVDVAIDQGGCIATSQPTSHDYPIFERFGVIHYCVTNMPGAFPRTATIALTNASFPFVLKLASNGLEALKRNPSFLNGLTTLNGKLVNQPVAKTFGREAENPLDLL